MAANRVSIAVLRRLRRSLIYTPLDRVIEQRVRIASAESAHGDVIAALANDLPLIVTTREPNLEYVNGTVAKYGLLDLTYGIASTTLPMERPGLSILRQVGLLDGDRGALEQDLGSGEDFLDEMAGECGQQVYLKVFLQAERKSPADRWINAFGREPPPGYWPATFIVDDACLTNARSIWLLKHLYL